MCIGRSQEDILVTKRSKTQNLTYNNIIYINNTKNTNKQVPMNSAVVGRTNFKKKSLQNTEAIDLYILFEDIKFKVSLKSLIG